MSGADDQILRMARQHAEKLGQLVEKFAAMEPAKKEKLLGAVSSARPQLEKAMARIENMAGVGEIVGPTLSSFRAKLEQLH